MGFDGSDAPGLLFAYGTLMPRTESQARAQGFVADAVRGRLFDLGPYPGLIDVNDPSADWVEGYVRSVTWRELVERLDPYEDVAGGQYRRVATITRTGRRVWVYEYARPLPADVRGPITRWEWP